MQHALQLSPCEYPALPFRSLSCMQACHPKHSSYVVIGRMLMGDNCDSNFILRESLKTKLPFSPAGVAVSKLLRAVRRAQQ